MNALVEKQLGSHMSITVEAGFKHIADSAYAMLSRDEKLRGLTITAHQCLTQETQHCCNTLFRTFMSFCIFMK